MTRHLIDFTVESALERLNGELADLASKHGLTDKQVRDRLDEAWGLVGAWDEWCEAN